MKTQNTFLTAAAIAGLVFSVILTTTGMLGAQNVAQLEGDISVSSRTISPGVYDLSFREWRSGVLEPVSSLPAFGGPVVLFAHVEDIDGNPAQNGTVTFEYCGNFEPKETCDAGLARWTRLNQMSIGSCYCRSCGGLPDFDPGPGNACLFVTGTGNIPGDDGFRFKYAGRRGGVDGGMSGAANFTWTDAALTSQSFLYGPR